MALHIVTFRKEGVDWNCNSRILLACYQVTFRKEGVDWNFIMNLVLTASGVTFRKEGVDWNSKRHTLTSQEQNVTFRKEGVDWNKIFSILKIDRMVTFRKEGVDWNIWKSNITRAFGVTFRKEGVDWNNRQWVWISQSAQVTFRKEGVDWNWKRLYHWYRVASHLPQGRCGLKFRWRVPRVLRSRSPSARKVWIDKVNEYFEYCITFCKWLQFHRFDKEAPPPFRGDFAM